MSESINLQNIITKNLVLFLFIMLCFGYIISSFLPTFFTLASRPFNFSFRLLYMLISIYLILLAGKKIVYGKIPIVFWMLGFFLIIYTFRLCYDIFVEGIVFKGSIFFTLSNSVGGSFIPFFAIALWGNKINYDTLIRWSYYCLYLSVLLVFVLIFKLYGGINLEFFATRFAFLNEDGTHSTINPITLSFFGTNLSLLSLAIILFKRNYYKLICVAGFFAGCFLVVLGASRGPVVTLVAGIAYLLFMFLFRKRKNIYTKILTFVLFGIMVSVVTWFVSTLVLEDFTLFNRFTSLDSNSSVSSVNIRKIYWDRAWSLFVENPIFGFSYLDPVSFGYPHNIYLESLMATGLFGLIFFLIPICSLFFLKIVNDNQVFVFLFFLMISISSIFSGGLFINPFLWTVLGLLIHFKIIRGNKLYASY